MTEQATNSQKGKSGILTSVRASVGALSLAGEPGQQEKAGSLRASHSMDGSHKRRQVRLTVAS